MFKLTLILRKAILPILILSCCIPSIADSTEKTNTPIVSTNIQERIQDELELLLKQVLGQLNGIDTVLQDLALLVNNDQLAKNSNKTKIIESIRSLRSLINTIRSDTFTTIDLQSIYIMIKLNNALMDHLDQALRSGFKDLPVFDLSGQITRHLQTEVEPADILDELKKNDTKLNNLNKHANNAGLSWYNHAYRAFNNNILETASKYKLGKIAGISFAAGALWWWYTDSKLFPTLRPYLGYRPRFGMTNRLEATGFGTNSPAPGTGTGILGTPETKMIEFSQGFLPYANFALPILALSCKHELATGASWIKKKTKSMTNRLKGGIHKEEYEGICKKDPDITFNQVIGNEKAKTEGRKVVKYMEDPERYDRFRMQIERGILLIGKTRTGKTYFAEALAGEIKKIMKEQNRNSAELGFYNIKASLIVKHGIEYILEMAKKEAPCVLFIDEIDLLALQRVGGDRNMLYAFLTSMSGCFERDLDKRVIIIGATNNPQNLDRALKARGRFGMILEFTYPEYRERKQYLEKHLNALTLNMKSLDVEKLARETEGCSYEALLAIIREAFLQAKIKGAAINQELLEHALDTAVRNIIFETQKEIPENEQQIITSHIAGHAVAATLLPTSKKIAKITTLPILSEIEEEAIWETYSKKEKDGSGQKDERITQYGQMFTYHEKDSLAMPSETERLRLCTIELAGHAAEKIVTGSCGYSYHPEDTQKAIAHIKPIVFKGLRENELSKDELNRCKSELLALFKKCETEAHTLLERNKDVLFRVTEHLRKKEILSGEQVTAIIHDTDNKLLKKTESKSSQPQNAAQIAPVAA